ncbi:senescence-specific cysteine protease SAG39-like [Solanum dulcamara]|uniref:senescence-specific cysteine protease SAG39-like n=1 Tax=Solanum dulcamara TaxID=45834 RepID=UPI00248526A6|nr:senescence-specific cysteine protease SAG39-like [Solanum dulcamara]
MALMFNLRLILATLLVLGMWACLATSRTLSDASIVEKHERWMAKHGRVYKDDIEKAERLKTFKQNLEYIESVNKAGTRTYKLGINEFADMTNEEFQATHNGYRMSSHQNLSATSFRYKDVAVPDKMNWIEKGVVTGIKQQGRCGCCWAFSAVAATEGINKITTDKLISLSEQELVDCDTSSNQGCEGGLMSKAFEFIIRNNGLTSESNYPFEGIDDMCKIGDETNNVAKITGYENVPTNSESDLLKAVANQPVSVAIDASGSDFKSYSSGVFTGECGTELNHGVTVVGYGEDSDDGTKYWLVKNSWGTSWGENGYIRMQRDIDDEEGLCGIAMQASYPTA